MTMGRGRKHEVAMFRRALLLLTLVLGVLFAQPALAQGSSIRDQLPPEARGPWDRGIQLYEVQDYRAAIAEFERAYEISKNPRTLYNVALTEKSLGRYVRAIARFKQELEEGKGKLTKKEEKEIKDAIVALQPFVSSVVVKANVDGAKLFVDDIEVGTSPFTAPTPIEVGRHQLKLTKEGYHEQTKSVTIVTEQAGSVDFELKPLLRTSRVSIRVEGAPKARIFVDGTDMGPAPYEGELKVDRHTIEARARGFVTARQTSVVEEGKPLSLTLTLSKERHEAKVQVRVSEPDAFIYVDGKIMGSGTWSGVLPSGGHQLVVEKPGFVTYSTDMALRDDQTRNVFVPLARERSATWIWWTTGAVAVIAGGAIASYFVFRGSDEPPVSGTLAPNMVTTSFR